MFQDKVLKAVQAGMQRVPAPVARVMRTGPAMAGCVVVGGALTAYGAGKCSGSQAIAGVAIGLGTVGLQAVPLGKVFSFTTGLIGIKRK